MFQDETPGALTLVGREEFGEAGGNVGGRLEADRLEMDRLFGYPL
jgi:hypothetical protein